MTSNINKSLVQLWVMLICQSLLFYKFEGSLHIQYYQVEKLTLCIWAITSVWEQFWRALPFISRISSATSRSALSAGEPGWRGGIRSDLITTNLPTVKFDTFVIGLHQNNDVTSKIHHFPLVLPTKHLEHFLGLFASVKYSAHHFDLRVTVALWDVPPKHKVFLWKYPRC